LLKLKLQIESNNSYPKTGGNAMETGEKKTWSQILIQKRFPSAFIKKEFGGNKFFINIPKPDSSPRVLGSGVTEIVAWREAAKKVHLA
jgi:hypothetical protein